MKNKFIDFLIENNSYNKYVKNIRHNRKVLYGFGLNDKTLDNLLDSCLHMGTISGSFLFVRTPEGDGYWRSLSHKWFNLKLNLEDNNDKSN